MYSLISKKRGGSDSAAPAQKKKKGLAKMDMDFKRITCDNTTCSTLDERMERAIWLNYGIEMLGETIFRSDSSYNADEIAHAMQSISWELGAELAAINTAIDNMIA